LKVELIHIVRRGESMGNSEGDSSGSEGGDDVYKRNAESVLVSLSDSYSDNEISVSDSRYSSCSAYTVTDY